MEDTLVGTAIPLSLLPLLGSVVACFSSMENELEATIADLLSGDREAGRAVTTEILNFSIKVEVFRNLVHVRVTDESDKVKLLKLADEIKQASDDRNRLFHDVAYGYSPSKQTIFLLRRDFGMPKPRPIKEVGQAELSGLSQRLLWLQSRLQQFRIKNPAWNDDANFPWYETHPARFP